MIKNIYIYPKEDLGFGVAMGGRNFGACLQSVSLDALNGYFWSLSPKMW